LGGARGGGRLGRLKFQGWRAASRRTFQTTAGGGRAGCQESTGCKECRGCGRPPRRRAGSVGAHRFPRCAHRQCDPERGRGAGRTSLALCPLQHPPARSGCLGAGHNASPIRVHVSTSAWNTPCLIPLRVGRCNAQRRDECANDRQRSCCPRCRVRKKSWGVPPGRDPTAIVTATTFDVASHSAVKNIRAARSAHLDVTIGRRGRLLSPTATSGPVVTFFEPGVDALSSRGTRLYRSRWPKLCVSNSTFKPRPSFSDRVMHDCQDLAMAASSYLVGLIVQIFTGSIGVMAKPKCVRP